jgi:hypothetical protein
VIRFNGTNQYVTFGNVLNLGLNGISIFMVAKYSIATPTLGMIGKTSFRANSGRWGMTYDTVNAGANGVGVNFFIEDGNQILAGMAFNPATQFNIFTAVNNRSSTNTIYANGTLGNERTFTQSIPNLSNTDHLFVASYPNNIGTAPQAGYYMNGDICEILVYFSTLSTPQRQRVEAYLADKWGLRPNLPSVHPYKLTTP